jgi:hypothetical protein
MKHISTKEEMYRGLIIRAICFELADGVITSLAIWDATFQEGAIIDLPRTTSLLPRSR